MSPLRKSKTRRLGALNLCIGLVTCWALWRFGIVQSLMDQRPPGEDGSPALLTPFYIRFGPLLLLLLTAAPILGFAGLWQLASGRGFLLLLVLWQKLPYRIQIAIGLGLVAAMLGTAGLIFLRISGA